MFVLGYEIEAISDISNVLVNVDEFIDLLAKLKIQFFEEMNNFNANISEITLERLEGEELVVKNPIPYIISY
jgi:hypothetical protein